MNERKQLNHSGIMFFGDVLFPVVAMKKVEEASEVFKSILKTIKNIYFKGGSYA